MVWFKCCQKTSKKKISNTCIMGTVYYHIEDEQAFIKLRTPEEKQQMPSIDVIEK